MSVQDGNRPRRLRFSLNVSVFVIVRDQRRILLLRRANTGWKDGHFSLPAGGHDGNETLAHAAARELREETGLAVKEEDLELVHLLHCRAGDTDTEWLGAFFEATRYSGIPQLMEPDKHDCLTWFAADKLPDNIIAYTRQGIELAARGERFSTYGWSSAI